MKTLILMRHAKAKRGPEFPSDLERPLAKRGKEEAAAMGELLARRGLLPQLIVSSPAKRALATAKRLAADAPLSADPRLYSASIADHLAVIRSLPDEAQIALLVGHNPAFEELVGHLAGRAAPLGTAHAAVIAFDAPTWAQIGAGDGELRAVLAPDV